MDNEQQKSAKVGGDSLWKDQKENSGLVENNEPIDADNPMFILQETYSNFYLPGINGMASVGSVYHMMTGEAHLFTYLEHTEMQAHQIQ